MRRIVLWKEKPGYQKALFFLCLLLIISGTYSCQDKAKLYDPVTGLHPAVQKVIDERVERYRNRLLKNCERKVLTEATQRVDSTIIANAKRIKAISVDRPPKPIRPREDGSAPEYDTTKIEPLWDLDSLLYEQLLRRRQFEDSLVGIDSVLIDSLMRDSLLLDSLYYEEKKN